jgi:hypothetical protein
MPQVSVIPKNTSPAPKKAEQPIHAGVGNSSAAFQSALERDRCLPVNDRHASLIESERPTLKVEDISLVYSTTSSRGSSSSCWSECSM